MAKKKTNPKVSLRAKKAFKIMVENGGNASAAMREAGYSKATAKSPSKLTKSKGWKELMDEYLPDEELVKVHKSLLKSMRVERLVLHQDTPDDDIKELVKNANCTLKKIYIFMGEKHVVFWSPNDKARTDALDIAYKLRGNYAPQKMEINKKISDMTDEELAQLIEEEQKKIAK